MTSSPRPNRLPLDWASRIDKLRPFGLNLAGIADGARYNHVLPGCRSVVVWASAGPSLWQAMETEFTADPRLLTNEDHPLDRWVARKIAQIDPAAPPSRRWVRAAFDETLMIDFRTLALEAGLGFESKLGMVIHPKYGLWLGLRAACFTTDPLPLTDTAHAPHPCETCPAPCVDTCPAGAVHPKERWDVGRCATFHQESDTCSQSCPSRLACPIGTTHRYSPLEVTYHYNRNIGRPMLAKKLGISDQRKGTGPYWDDWSDA